MFRCFRYEILVVSFDEFMHAGVILLGKKYYIAEAILGAWKREVFDTLKYFWEIFLVFLEVLVDPHFPCLWQDDKMARWQDDPRLHSPGTAYGKNCFLIMILIICTFVLPVCVNWTNRTICYF